MTRAQDVDCSFVEMKRSAGIGWSAISRMTGANEADLRRIFDPTVSAEILTMTARPLSPGEIVERHLKALGFGADEALIVRRLWLANGSDVSNVDLARGIAGGGAMTDAIGGARRMLAVRTGIRAVRSVGKLGYRMDAADVVALSRAAGIPRGRP